LKRSEFVALTVMAVAALVWSGVAPLDRFTWFLEVAPILVAVPVLAWTRGRFPLTRLAYWLIFFHALVLMVGGHYTYAEVPVGYWVKDLLHLSRNHYDRLGHFMQGFVPALLTREVLLRTSPLRRGWWLSFLIVSVCLAISALYELIEWGTAMATGSRADAFLGTQGDVWDTQWDMFMALVGAVTALVTVRRLHDRQLERL
jgi:putative membrane protein